VELFELAEDQWRRVWQRPILPRRLQGAALAEQLALGPEWAVVYLFM
jgi:hypothetical protein